MHVSFSRILTLVLAGICLHGTTNAQPQPRDPAGAERLFAESRRLLDAGRYAEACQKLADSQQLDPAVGTLLNLAQCYVKLGRTATAWATYREAADAARAAGQTERETKAIRAAEALQADLAKLMVSVPDAAAAKGVEVKRNGMVLPKSLWGTAEPIDPGEYLIEARAPGTKTWSIRVKVEPSRVAVVMLPPFDEQAAVPSASPIAAGTTSASSMAASEPTARDSFEPERPKTLRRVAEYGLLALGVAGVVTGTVEVVRLKSKNDEINNICPGDRCLTSETFAKYTLLGEEAASARTISWIGFGVGGAAVAGSALLFFTEPSGKHAGMGSILPGFIPQGVGLQWARTW